MNMDARPQTVSAQELKRNYDLEVRKQLVTHLSGKTTELCPQTFSVDPRIYADPIRWQAEKEKLFRETPLLACLSLNIPKAGDMITFDAAGPSILIVRAKDGTVNAFLNVCTHRAAKLVT